MTNQQPLSLLLINNIGNKTAMKTLNSINWKPDVFTDSEFIEQLKSINFNRVEEVNDTLEKAKSIIDQYLTNQINTVSYFDNDYPKKFKDINNPPVVFYYKGHIKHFLQSTNIAVIGTRKPSDNASRLSFETAQVIAQNLSSVISGLALGCDTAAHKGCLDSKGHTMAILPSPITEIYPKSNIELADEIIANNGCLLSEYAPGTSVINSNFIQRDRLQSGISDVVIVVETDVDGGTMHTVKYSVEQNKIIGCFDLSNSNDELASGNKKILSMKNVHKLQSIEDVIKLINNLPELKEKLVRGQLDLFSGEG